MGVVHRELFHSLQRRGIENSQKQLKKLKDLPQKKDMR